MLKNSAQQSEGDRRRRPPSPVEPSKVFSYRASRAIETDTRQRLRPEATAVESRALRRSRWLSLRYAPTFIAGLAIIGCIAYNTVLSSTPRIIVSGNAGEQLLLKDVKTYQDAIKNELNSTIWNASKLTFNAAAVTESLTKQFPEVSTLRITLPLIGQKPIVYIVPTAPKLVLDTSAGSFVLDGSGRAIADSTDQVNSDTLRVKDNSGVALSVGEQALPQSNIVFIEEIVRQLAAKDIVVTEIALPEASQSVLVRISGKPYQIKFSFQGDTLQQVGAFMAVYDRHNQTNVNPNQYVDVRVGDRVYFQ